MSGEQGGGTAEELNSAAETESGDNLAGEHPHKEAILRYREQGRPRYPTKGTLIDPTDKRSHFLYTAHDGGLSRLLIVGDLPPDVDDPEHFLLAREVYEVSLGRRHLALTTGPQFERWTGQKLIWIGQWPYHPHSKGRLPDLRKFSIVPKAPEDKWRYNDKTHMLHLLRESLRYRFLLHGIPLEKSGTFIGRLTRFVQITEKNPAQIARLCADVLNENLNICADHKQEPLRVRSPLTFSTLGDRGVGKSLVTKLVELGIIGLPCEGIIGLISRVPPSLRGSIDFLPEQSFETSDVYAPSRKFADAAAERGAGQNFDHIVQVTHTERGKYTMTDLTSMMVLSLIYEKILGIPMPIDLSLENGISSLLNSVLSNTPFIFRFTDSGGFPTEEHGYQSHEIDIMILAIIALTEEIIFLTDPREEGSSFPKDRLQALQAWTNSVLTMNGELPQRAEQENISRGIHLFQNDILLDQRFIYPQLSKTIHDDRFPFPTNHKKISQWVRRYLEIARYSLQLTPRRLQHYIDQLHNHLIIFHDVVAELQKFVPDTHPFFLHRYTIPQPPNIALYPEPTRMIDYMIGQAEADAQQE